MSIELTEKYLTTEAEDKAKEFSKPSRQGDPKSSPVLDKNQLRKFYDDFKLLEKKMESTNKFEEEILPLIKFTKSKIAYNAGRDVGGKKLIPEEFKKHIYSQIDEIKTEKDFRNFLMHYQAIIGYYTYNTKDVK